MVQVPKTKTTAARPAKLLFAAGYMRIGISGSHGPNTRMVKSIQGVRLTVFSPFSCT